jgi:hypothetical protein
MKRISAIALVTLAGVFAASSALAQDLPVRANVPFSFNVGNKVMPAGHYTISPVMGSVIAIKNWDASTSALSATSQDDTSSQGGPALVFYKYGDQYFLCKIIGSPGFISAALPESKAERKARNQETMASNQSLVSIPAEEAN